jgi:hypothetical protein
VAPGNHVDDAARLHEGCTYANACGDALATMQTIVANAAGGRCTKRRDHPELGERAERAIPPAIATRPS